MRLGPVFEGLREVEDGLKPDDWVIIEDGWYPPGGKVIPDRLKSLAGS